MADKFSFGEGASLNRPPLFCGKNYQLWCIRMKFFVDSIDRKIWNVITNNSFTHLLETNVVLSKNEKHHLDNVLRTSLFMLFIIMNFLKFQSVSQLKRCGILLKEFIKIQEVLG